MTRVELRRTCARMLKSRFEEERHVVLPAEYVIEEVVDEIFKLVGQEALFKLVEGFENKEG